MEDFIDLTDDFDFGTTSHPNGLADQTPPVAPFPLDLDSHPSVPRPPANVPNPRASAPSPFPAAPKRPRGPTPTNAIYNAQQHVGGRPQSVVDLSFMSPGNGATMNDINLNAPAPPPDAFDINGIAPAPLTSTALNGLSIYQRHPSVTTPSPFIFSQQGAASSSAAAASVPNPYTMKARIRYPNGSSFQPAAKRQRIALNPLHANPHRKKTEFIDLTLENSLDGIGFNPNIQNGTPMQGGLPLYNNFNQHMAIHPNNFAFQQHHSYPGPSQHHNYQREMDRIRVGNPSVHSNSNQPPQETVHALIFGLDNSNVRSVVCKVDLKVNDGWISALTSVRGVTSRKPDPNEEQEEVVVPFQSIEATNELIQQKLNLKMVFSFPYYIIDRLNELFQSHKEREESGDVITEPLEKMLPDSIAKALMPFQWEGVRFAVRNGGRVLIGDDMGLGKTLQAISVAQIYSKDWPLLIVCPSSLRHNWKEELLMWLDISEDDILVVMKGVDCDSRFRKINIVSYDLIRKVEFSKLEQCKFIIADECHYLKSKDAKRSQAVTPLIKKAKRALLLSGTPALSRPVELFTQVNSLVPSLFPNFVEYAERYCEGHNGRFGYDAKGSANLDELHTILRASVLIRRKKADVLTQLPSKRREVVWVKKDPIIMAKIDALQAGLARIKKQSGMDEATLRQHQAGMQSKLYNLAGQCKVPSVLNAMKSASESGRKFIIFAHHKDVMDSIDNFLTKNLKLQFIRIDGNTSQGCRQALCKSFQEDPKVRVSLLSITAAGVGLTLTAAKLVLFAELYWTPGSLIQAEDRAHRIGQSDCVVVKYLLADGTCDNKMWKTVKRKFNVIGKSLAGTAQTIEVANLPNEKPEDLGPDKKEFFSEKGHEKYDPNQVVDRGSLALEKKEVMLRNGNENLGGNPQSGLGSTNITIDLTADEDDSELQPISLSVSPPVPVPTPTPGPARVYAPPALQGQPIDYFPLDDLFETAVNENII